MKFCQGPQSDTVSPGFALPANACDAHCHVFGPAAKFPFAEGRAYTPPDAPVELLRKMHGVLGLSRAVLVQATCHGTDNSAMVYAISQDRKSYRGVAIVDDGFSEKEFEALHAGGVRGVRFSFARHLGGGAPDFSLVKRVAEKIAPFGWHVVLYLEAKDVVENAAVLSSLPVPVLIDHMGRVKTSAGLQQEPFKLLLQLIRNEDFWVKICGAERISSKGYPYDDAVPFAKSLIAAAPDRILWGTDWPHPNIEGYMPNDGDLLKLLLQYVPEEALRRRVLVENPARLYDFDI